MQPVIICHGGAWKIPDHLIKPSRDGIRQAVLKGYETLQAGGSAMDAVEQAVRVMEDNPVFDAGRGSVLNEEEEIEMDAMIMCGQSLNYGAVAGIRNILHPISLARKVAEETPHSMLVAEGAMKLARELGIAFVSKDELISEDAIKELEELRNFGDVVNTVFSGHDTVGAVAIDQEGKIAAATSTGGITGKKAGRVGDTPLIGAGGIADVDGGVSTTGHGESIMRVLLASRILQGINQGKEVSQAIKESLRYMRDRVKGFGGAIAINSAGEFGVGFSTEKMVWGAAKNNVYSYGIEQGERIEESI